MTSEDVAFSSSQVQLPNQSVKLLPSLPELSNSLIFPVYHLSTWAFLLPWPQGPTPVHWYSGIQASSVLNCLYGAIPDIIIKPARTLYTSKLIMIKHSV